MSRCYTLKVFLTDRSNEKVMDHYYRLASRDRGGAYIGDAGIDLPYSEDFIIPAKKQLNGIGFKTYLGICCEMVDCDGNSVSFIMMPRSSISKTAFRMSNSIGLIDSGYRGELQVRLDNNLHDPNSPLQVKAGCYFQIVAPGYQPIKVELVDSMDALQTSDRGSNAFGSSSER